MEKILSRWPAMTEELSVDVTAQPMDQARRLVM
jgi:hypothetical protein